MAQDRIVYKLISKGGGIDGRDHTDQGGQLRAAFWSKVEAQASSLAPWCEVVPEIVNVEAAKRAALAKLNAIDLLVLRQAFREEWMRS